MTRKTYSIFGAGAAGLSLYVGSWSICPTSKTYKKNWGTAEEQRGPTTDDRREVA